MAGGAGCRGLLLLIISLVVLYIVREFRGSIIAPPYCAWRFVSNFDSWNVAFPDSTSIYHVSLMRLDEGDEIVMEAASFPYARYFSFQSYSIPDFVSQASIRDIDMLSSNGPNVYHNLSAAKQGIRQGGYRAYITAHGDKGYPNELQALSDSVTSGYFVVFMRIYQDQITDQPPHPDIDLSCFAKGGEYEQERPQEWGWACPPTISVKRPKRWFNQLLYNVDEEGFQKLSMCKYRRKKGIKIYNDVTVPIEECQMVHPNQQQNFFYPSPKQLNSKFANHDAKYLFSCVDSRVPEARGGSDDEGGESQRRSLALSEKEKHIKKQVHVYARVTGQLPKTPASLYKPPYIADLGGYEVRYVSISSVGRSIPYRGYKTFHDLDIKEHYQKEMGSWWDGSYTIWLGPDIKELPPIIKEEKAMYLPWGKSFEGDTIPYPGILYRQILTRGQVARRPPFHPRGNQTLLAAGKKMTGRLSPHHSGVAEIVPEECEAEEGARFTCGDDVEQKWLAKSICCGENTPLFCHHPEYVALRLQKYYPKVGFFYTPEVERMSRRKTYVELEESQVRSERSKLSVTEDKRDFLTAALHADQRGERDESSISSTSRSILSDMWSYVTSIFKFGR